MNLQNDNENYDVMLDHTTSLANHNSGQYIQQKIPSPSGIHGLRDTTELFEARLLINNV